MRMIDLISVSMLISGLPLMVAGYFIVKSKKIRVDIWPYIFGIGIAAFIFMWSMISSLLLRPSSTPPDIIATNCFWAGLMGIGAYVFGLALARRHRNR